MPVPDSLLINGAGRFDCSMSVPARPVECESIHEDQIIGLLSKSLISGPIRLRVVNVGYVDLLRFSYAHPSNLGVDLLQALRSVSPPAL
jgi:hypothetical protein